ncbi:MAG: alanine--tRNA ligase-related protein, partial [Alphaproteobacteria bacterium]
MTEKLFLADAYLKSCEARIDAITAEGGIVLNQSVFYATGGGQPGDSGSLSLKDGRSIAINTCIKGENDVLVLLPTEGVVEGLSVGDVVEAVLDWDRRFAHMAMHT